MSKPPRMRIASSSNQRFLRATRQRVTRKRRMRLLTGLIVFAVVAVFYHFAGRDLALNLWGRITHRTGEWKAGTESTFRHIQKRESAGGLNR